jgi:pimeloyl-ACP methyl ester carboxylesterase
MRFGNVATLPTITTVNTEIDNYVATDGATVNIIGMHYNYQQFKTNAATGNLVYVLNNQIFDTPGRSTTPYEVKDAFAFAPTKDNLSGGQQTFLLRSDLFYKNVTKTIASIQIDCNDGGGFRNITLGQAININYTTNGAKNLIVRVSYADGQVLQSQSRINIVNIDTQTCSNCRYSAPLIEFFPKGNFPVPVSQMGFSFATIATAGNDGILDKPLILVEGFDPENSFNYDSYFRPDALGININRDFSGQTLAQALETAGYDLIFVNFGQGGDDIKRNAYLMENIIQWVNQQTAAVNSTQKNVVIGVSMGGLVARYALRDMELRNYNHNTRLYASIDSPHQGANVPLGFQAAVKFMDGLSFFGQSLSSSAPELKRAVNALNSPAAQQMLTYQLSGSGSSIAFTNNQAFVNFYNEYKTMGLPRQWGIRNVAVANGSECAQNQGFSPYSMMLSGNGTQSINYLVNLLFGAVQFAGSLNPFQFFEGFFTTKSELRADIAIRSLPDRQVQPLFFFRISYKKEILFGLIQSEQDLVNFTFNSPGTLLPLDSNPGGTFDISRFASLPTNISLLNLNPAITRFGFIPTTSSLDVGSGTQPIDQGDYLRAYSTAAPPASPKNIPFNNFYSNPLSNEFHPSLTTRNGNWLYSELQGTPQVFSCNYLCSNTVVEPSVLGPDPLCSIGTFSLQNSTPSVPITWTSSNTSALTIVSLANQTGQANRVGSFSGTVTVTAVINGGCGNSSPYTKMINVGTPNSSNNAIVYISNNYGVNPITVNPSTGYNFFMDPVQGATSYNWSLPRGGGFSFLGPVPTTNAAVIRTGTSSGSYQVVCSPQNLCGSAGARFLTVIVQGGGGGIQQRAAFPNPANDSFTVKVKEEDSKEVAEVALFNKSMERVYFIRTEEKEINVSTANLLPGVYYLNVVLGKEVSQKQVIVNH